MTKWDKLHRLIPKPGLHLAKCFKFWAALEPYFVLELSLPENSGVRRGSRSEPVRVLRETVEPPRPDLTLGAKSEICFSICCKHK